MITAFVLYVFSTGRITKLNASINISLFLLNPLPHHRRDVFLFFPSVPSFAYYYVKGKKISSFFFVFERRGGSNDAMGMMSVY